MSQNALINSYESQSYTSRPFANSCIFHLQAVASLMGLKPANSTTARVLELGCAFGGNIIMSALSAPKTQFIGIDISPSQVAQGNEIIAKIGLNNIKLIALDLCKLTSDDNEKVKELGKFDYIIAHGLYSWVDASVRNSIFKVAAKMLANNGIFYASYNTYPGWKQKEILRDFMLFSNKQKMGQDTNLKQNENVLAHQKSALKGFLGYLKSLPDTSAPKDAYSKAFLDFASSTISEYDDFYILHEHLEQTNAPCYFSEFIADARASGLEYIVDSTLSPSFFTSVEHLGDMANSLSHEECEQYGDFLSCRPFRCSLLGLSKDIKANNALKNALKGEFELDAIKALHLKAHFNINGELISDESGMITLNPAIKPLALAFNEIFPSSITLPKLCERFASKLKEQIYISLVHLVCIGAINISAHPSVAIPYKVGKSRIKRQYLNYISYFASSENAKIAMADAQNALTNIASGDESALALLFDGKNSLKDIAKELKKMLDKKGLKLNLKPKQSQNDALLELIKALEYKLYAACYFEQI